MLKPFDSVKIIQYEINKAKDYTFTLLAKSQFENNFQNKKTNKKFIYLS